MGQLRLTKRRDLFKAQAAALLEGGVDLFCLETFSDVSEIRQAIAAIRELCDLPIIAQMTIMTDGNTILAPRPNCSPNASMNGAPTLSASTAALARRSF